MRASDLCLSGRLISGEEAHRIGLADRIADADELLDTAIEVAGVLRRQPGAAAAHDQGPADADRRPQTTSPPSSAPSIATSWSAGRSPEHAEAVTAFTEKRAARTSPADRRQQLVSAGGASRSMR